MHKSLVFLALSICSLLFYSSCKTADGRLTKLGKAYHNVTGRYNAYYHAGLRLDKAHETIRTQHKDNFNELIPLYPYIANSDTSSIKQPLDEAIKKLAMNIELHRPGHWTDDSYLMLGQVEFLKKQYPKAAETFKYIVDKYNPDKPKSAMSKEEIDELNRKNKSKSKKKKKKPSKKKKTSKKKKPTPKPDSEPTTEPEPKPKKRNRLKHQPNRHDAMLWLAKASVETKQYDDAGLYLRLLDQDPNTPKRLRSEIKAVQAHLSISQQEYAKAIPPLEEAIKLCRRRSRKARYTYVLAQLYDRQNNPQLAYQNFKKVIKLKPAYEMDLNARLAAAKTATKAGDSNANPELALRRMLRDEKNDEYQDQIYFALAEIQLRNGKTDDGIASLQKSLAAGKSGPQRTEAALLLASLYYEKQDFVPAFLYYDTTSQSIDKKDPRYTEVMARRAQLELFATNTLQLELHDSLLKISLLPYEEQKAYAQRVRKEQLLASAASSDPAKANTPATTRPLTMAEKAQLGSRTSKGGNAGPSPSAAPSVSENSLNASNFPLYNPNQLKRGEKEFEKRWGNRPWADNWRSSRLLEDNPATNPANNSNELQPMTEQETKDFLTQLGVALDDKQREELQKKIASNLLNIGTAEHEQLIRTDRAISTLDRLAREYPTTTQALEGLYILYNIYKQNGNTAKAEATKALILQHHPKSDIAKAVQNPNFVNARQSKDKDLNDRYQAAYASVLKHQFQDAISKINDAQTLLGEAHPLKARFALLAAMCEGGTKGEQDYIKALRVVSTSFPNTEEDKKAKEIVALLTKGTPNTNPSTTKTNTPSENPDDFKFTENNNTGHYVLIVFEDPKIKMDPLRTPIDNFNKDNYSSARLNVASLMVENTIPTITVRKFSNAEQALNYRIQALANPKFLGDAAPPFQIYVVGQDNYRLLLQPPFGKFEQYIRFHNNFYKIN